MFRNREEAGRRLAERLMARQPLRPLVLALPRGGVPVAYQIATALRAPLDLVLVRKIGVPFQPELALGAVVDGARPEIVVNDDIAHAFDISQDEIAHAAARAAEEIERRRHAYLRGRALLPVAGRTAIVVDDGIATGATMRAALQALRRRGPERLVLAVPVAPHDTIAALRAVTDEIICLEMPRHFTAVGAYYDDFSQLSDEEVIALLDQAGRQGSERAPE